MTETWKPIPGYEDKYQVSDAGQVINTRNGRLLKQSGTGSGLYPSVSLNCKKFMVHRLVMLAFKGDCPAGHEVNHINGIKTDNQLSNLEYITHLQNMRHSTSMTGYPITKLNEDKVREIRTRHSIGNITYAALGREYGVSKVLVSGIVKRTRWQHVA